jgi:similar to stage IV sporulation protein
VKSWYLWLTALFCFCLLLLFTASVWQVEVTDEDGDTLTEKETKAILVTAADCGIHPLVMKKSVDYDAAAETILAAYPSLAWVGFDVKGVTVTVRVAAKEKSDPKSVSYGHIVATKNAVIREVFVLKGQKKVEVGDTVEAGDILISGLITYEEEGKEPVSDVTAAKGMIKAAVWYEGVSYVSLHGIDVAPTGKESGTVTVVKEDEVYTLWGSDETSFDNAVTEEREFPIFLGMTVKVKNINEVVGKEKVRTQEEALSLAKKQAKTVAEKKLPKGVDIVDEHLEELTDKEGAVGVRVIIETEEDIGEFSPMQ